MTITHHTLTLALAYAAIFCARDTAYGATTPEAFPKGHTTSVTTHDPVGHRVLLVYFDPEIGAAPLREAVSKDKAEILYSYQYINAIAISLNPKSRMQKSIKRFSKVKGVINVLVDKTVQCDHAVPDTNPHQGEAPLHTQEKN